MASVIPDLRLSPRTADCWPVRNYSAWWHRVVYAAASQGEVELSVHVSITVPTLDSLWHHVSYDVRHQRWFLSRWEESTADVAARASTAWSPTGTARRTACRRSPPSASSPWSSPEVPPTAADLWAVPRRARRCERPIVAAGRGRAPATTRTRRPIRRWQVPPGARSSRSRSSTRRRRRRSLLAAAARGPRASCARRSWARRRCRAVGRGGAPCRLLVYLLMTFMT